MSDPPYWDPYDYAIDADAHPVWKRLRDEDPVYRNERFDFYALSRFRDVFEAHLDAETFSNARGTILEIMPNPPEPAPMIFRDPPEHTALRKLVGRAFGPRRIAGLEKPIREIAGACLDPQRDRGGFDFVADFGALLPAYVMSSMLGVPEEDREQIRLWTDAIMHREPGETSLPPRLESVQAELSGYFARTIAARRRSPRDDMMTDLIEAEIETPEGGRRRLTDVELLTFIGMLSSAGNETVARALGWAGALLARFPEQRRRLARAPGLVPNAFEEVLRYEHPGKYQGRTVTRDVVLHGTRVPRGSKLLLITPSAGRDEREFPDADRFDVARRIDRSVAWGFGIHFCLGAALGRLEGRVALEEVLRRFPEWEVVWEETARVHTTAVRGYERLPVRF